MVKDKVSSESAEELTAASQNEAQMQEEQLKALPEEASVEALKAELEVALAEAATSKEEELRAQAEMQNIRRRAERDVENAHKFALDKMVQELLPVVDNLERALSAGNVEDETTKALRDGVDLTLASFVTALSKFKVEQVSPEGEPFDPQLHQAMTMVENNEVEPNSVVAVLQKGYTLHGRLVRPAMVVVSKAGEKGSSKVGG